MVNLDYNTLASILHLVNDFRPLVEADTPITTALMTFTKRLRDVPKSRAKKSAARLKWVVFLSGEETTSEHAVVFWV